MPDQPTSERTRVQLCGRLSIELDGRELVGDLRGRQVRLLFAFLALHRDRAVSRDELAEAMWPDRAPRSQDGALRVLLSRLRSGLGGEAVRGREEMSLELPAPVWIDLEAATVQVPRAQEALHRGDARAAWALAQVPLNIAGRGLLPGAQAPWLEPPRRELAETRLEALETIGRAGLALGGTQLGSVERAGRTLIELEAYRESGYVLLMEALAAQGNVAEGLRVYERLRALLRDELGTMPSADAIAVHERLLTGGAAVVREDVRPPAGGDDDGAIELPGVLTLPADELVGRRDELAELHGWWEQPAGRTPAPRIVLLAGEPGAGKTRLLAETAARVHASGAVVLAGRAPEETLVPYQPFLEAIGHLAYHAPQALLRDAARSSGAELARLVPELRRRLPELPAAEAGDPETDRYRLFEATADLLGALAGLRPLLIVLDDLHWADRPTLLMLRHLVHSPQARRLRIVAAHRLGEEPEGFGQMIGGLRREGLLRQLEVTGLPREDAVELVRRRAGAGPSAAYLSALWEETEGNPFFIEELVRHLDESGVHPAGAGPAEVRRAGLPDDVRDLISRRLARLSADGLECLRMAAVIGREVDGRLLEQVLGMPEDRFLAGLEEALDAGLVREAPGEPGRYAFAHALIRETLYGGLSSVRRARSHQRVGRALEASPDEATVGALAHHFTHAPEAQDAERALTYALAAGEQATEMLAHEDAVEHYARALELLARVDPGAASRRCALLIALGEARLRSGERATAWPAFREAAAIASELGDAAALVRAALGASRRFIQPPGLVDEELIAMLREALVATDERTVVRVRLLGRLCAALYHADADAEMRRCAAEATAIAAELADAEAAALAAAARRRAFWRPEHLERRLADSTMLLRAAREAGDLELTLQGHAWLLNDLLEAGDRVAVEAQVTAFEEGARGLRQPLYGWNVLLWRAMLALLDGRLDDADRLAADALSVGSRPEGGAAILYYLTQLSGIRREQLRSAELLVRRPDVTPAHIDTAPWRAATCLLMADVGRRDRAAAMLGELVGSDAPEPPRDGDWLAVTVALAEVAAELGDAVRCGRLYEALAPYDDAIVVFAAGAMCGGSVSHQLGRLAIVLGERQRAIAHLERAVEANLALRAPVLTAHAQVDLARALGATSAGTRAAELLETAGGTAQLLGLARLARRVEQARAPVV